MDRTADILADVIRTLRDVGTVRRQIEPKVAADFVDWGRRAPDVRPRRDNPPETDADCARVFAAAISAMLFLEYLPATFCLYPNPRRLTP